MQSHRRRRNRKVDMNKAKIERLAGHAVRKGRGYSPNGRRTDSCGMLCYHFGTEAADSSKNGRPPEKMTAQAHAIISLKKVSVGAMLLCVA